MLDLVFDGFLFLTLRAPILSFASSSTSFRTINKRLIPGKLGIWVASRKRRPPACSSLGRVWVLFEERMSMKGVDEAFRGAGAKTGLEIWCIENGHPVPMPKSSHGKFFSGSTYIILSTAVLKSGLTHHDIHYWLGKDAEEVDSSMASDKAIELDAALGSRAVQYREVQGFETQKFLSYFKPCIIPVEGVFSSELQGLGGKSYRVSLLSCTGDHVVRVREVPFSRSSLNHNDVFILDTQSKIFLFSGRNSSMQERAKALEVVQYIKENQHGGRCEVATLEDGKLVGDSDSGEFWNLFGGYAPITRDQPCADQMETIMSSTKLFWINKGKLFPIDAPSLNRGMLSSDKCYMLDCDAEIFIWMGRMTLVSERKASISAIEEIVHSHVRSASTRTTFLTEGSENVKFKSYFTSWPQTLTTNLYEEGRGKVAAIFKHQGYDVKELPDNSSQPFIDCCGDLKVWWVSCHGASLVPAREQGKLYSGDCYIVQYTYTKGERDDHLFYAWFGKNSILEDGVNAISFMSSTVDSTKGCSAMAQIFEGKEPVLFFAIFKSLIIFKGGMSPAYKKSMTQRALADETYDKDRTALFRVQGTGPDNMQAIQVDQVSTSLNSSYCYILQDGSFIFAWTGSLSLPSDHDLLNSMLDKINPLKQPMLVREGSEPDIFWSALGGKAEYPREKDIKDYTEDPHLFTCNCSILKGKEIFNFTQDDLTTEDVLVLDCHDEIYIWVGLHANVTSKEQALNLGKKFLQADILQEGLSIDAAVYVITEGNEPPFFTRFFNWDDSKTYMHGNSFERKLAMLKGSSRNVEAPDIGFRKAFRRYSEHTPDGSIRNLSISDRLYMRDGSSESSSVMEESSFNSRKVEEIILDNCEENDTDDVLEKLPYELLKVPSSMPITGIDVTRREAYLSAKEFQEKFGMSKKAFYQLPKWRQNKLKLSLGLF
ncbi:villin-1 [Elaeis guineensis]|uniref:villin-1 n=1 Tax=Elaeis guineensis var. tenera TaxID=51953 RepID=UPI003C6CDF39